MNKIILNIEGMTCSACSNSLEKYLKKQDGIIDVSVNLVLAQAMISYNDSLSVEDLNRFVKEAGFKSLGEFQENIKKENKKNYLIFMAFLLCVLMYISMGHMFHLPVFSFFDPVKNSINYVVILFLLTTLFLVWAREIIFHGIRNLFYGKPNMDTLVTLGVLSSFGYSLFGMIMIFVGKSDYVHFLYFESVAMVLFFVKLGRFIDEKSKEKTRKAIEDLVQITPTMALLKTKGGEKKITIDEVKVHDILICKPGMKIAVDGIIVKGCSHFDESFITGESVKPQKTISDKVIAGSLNYDGYVEYEALKIGRESIISEVVQLVMESINTKAPIARIADIVSGYFVPVMIVLAILTFLVYLCLGNSFVYSLQYFVTVLLVACPCALGLATPLAIVISEGVCARKGILVKNSETLEMVHTVNTIVFDKTGTLTYGDLKISNITIFEDMSVMEVMGYAASLEEKSSHPIREAFLNFMKEKKYSLLEVSDFKNFSGMGLKGVVNGKKVWVGNAKLLKKESIKNDYESDEKNLKEKGNTIVYVVINKKIVALIGVSDVLRKEASSVIKTLKTMDIDVIMLTGDNKETAKKIGKLCGIDNIVAEVLPVNKNSYIKKLLQENKKVMMVGDGINDAPALSISTVGVSVSSGTDIANNSAGVILLQDNLIKIVELIRISKQTIRNIKQNLFWAFFYNCLMIPIAMGLFKNFGITINPMIASLAMTLSSLTVVFNALRLKKM